MWQLNNLRLGKSISGGGGGSTTRGPSLDLNFVSMDEQYKNLQTLDLNFTDQTYQRWETPSEPQGAYKVWIGPASW